MTPVNNRAQTFQTPLYPAGYHLQSYSLNTDTKMDRMLFALTGRTPSGKTKNKKHKHPSAPRRFSWEG